MSDERRLLTIGEVAESVGITRRMILNYEDRGLVAPDMKNGKNGNRYYTADSLTRIRTIRTFQDIGLTLDEIRSYYDGSSDLSAVLVRLETLRDKLDLNIKRLRERIQTKECFPVQFDTFPRQTIYRRTIRTATIEERTNRLRDVFLDAILQYGSSSGKRWLFIETPLDDPELISYCIAVPDGSRGKYIEELTTTQALCIYHHGSYSELPAVCNQLSAYADAHQIRLAGVCRRIFLEGPPQHKDPAKFITQIMMPLAPSEI